MYARTANALAAAALKRKKDRPTSMGSNPRDQSHATNMNCPLGRPGFMLRFMGSIQKMASGHAGMAIPMLATKTMMSAILFVTSFSRRTSGVRSASLRAYSGRRCSALLGCRFTARHGPPQRAQDVSSRTDQPVQRTCGCIVGGRQSALRDRVRIHETCVHGPRAPHPLYSESSSGASLLKPISSRGVTRFGVWSPSIAFTRRM